MIARGWAVRVPPAARCVIPAIFLACAPLIACSEDDASISVSRYPMDAGRTWTYVTVFSVDTFDGQGLREEARDTLLVEALGEVEFAGRSTQALRVRPFSTRADSGRVQYYEERPDRLLLLGHDGGMLKRYVLPSPGPNGLAPGVERRHGASVSPGPGRSAAEFHDPVVYEVPHLIFLHPLRVGREWTVFEEDGLLLRRWVDRVDAVSVLGGNRVALRVDAEAGDLRYSQWLDEDGLLLRRVEHLFTSSVFGDSVLTREQTELIAIGTP